MSITSVSFTFVNMYASQAPSAVRPAAERAAPVETAKAVEPQRYEGKQNRLVQAMMTALRELGVGGTSAAPVAATGNASAGAAAAAVSGTAPAAANDASAEAGAASEVAATKAADSAGGDLASAVYQFAHELMKSMRQAGRGDSGGDGMRGEGDDGSRRHHHQHVHGHHGHHGRHGGGHHGWRREGYGDMSQRLEALANRYAPQPATASAATPIASAASMTLTVESDPAVVAEPDAPATTVSAAGATAAAEEGVADPIASTIAEPAGANAGPARNPLLQAFSKLFSALQPQAAATMSESDMAGKLRQFLQSLAQALKPDVMAQPDTPAVGGLLNLAA